MPHQEHVPRGETNVAGVKLLGDMEPRVPRGASRNFEYQRLVAGVVGMGLPIECNLQGSIFRTGSDHYHIFHSLVAYWGKVTFERAMNILSSTQATKYEEAFLSGGSHGLYWSCNFRGN